MDFEAFAARPIDLWTAAMRVWADLASRWDWKFSIFIALEDVVRLRARGRGDYLKFLGAVGALGESSCVFYPHNHEVFDPKDGQPLATDRPERVPGYAKRASFFYDCAYRHHMDVGHWMRTIRGLYEDFLHDASLRLPQRPAFRAGGWDHGSSKRDLERYISGLIDAGFNFDTSSSSGMFGTRSWRVGAPFGSNIFALTPTLVEAAPCWFVNCAARTLAISTLGSALTLIRQPRTWTPPRRPGALVTVIHFDHLFHRGRGGNRRLFAVEDERTVVARIERFFSRIAALRRLLRARSATLEDLALSTPDGTHLSLPPPWE